MMSVSLALYYKNSTKYYVRIYIYIYIYVCVCVCV